MKKKKKAQKKVLKKKKAVTKTKKKKSASVKTVKKVEKKVAAKEKKKPAKASQPSSKPKSSLFAGAALEEIGVVTHYFPHVEAAVVKLTKGSLSVGDTIIIKGHTTEFKEKVESIQLNHVPITSGSPEQEIGLKVKSKVRDGDVVYKVVG